MIRILGAMLFALLASPMIVGAVNSPAPAAQPAAGVKAKQAFYDAVGRKAYPEALRLGADYLSTHPNDDVFRLDYAYALLAAGRAADAMPQLERLANSQNEAVASAARKQLAVQGPVATPVPVAAGLLQQAYDASAKGNHAAAVTLLQQYLARNPADQTARLQLGYELDGSGRPSEATPIFKELAASTDPAVAAKAKQALASRTTASAGGDRGSVFGYVIHDSRFADTFYGADATYDLAQTRVRPYVVAHINSDTRSGVPGVSDVFNDNAVALDAGLKTALGAHLSAFAEAGYSNGLRGQPSFSDFRAGFNYYAEYGSRATGHTSLSASAVEYSRFAGNAISYAQLAHDFPIAGRLRGVAGLNGALDTHRDYFNNFIEVFGGLQFAIDPVTFRLVRVYGSYLDRGVNRPQTNYGSTRAELIFGVPIR